MGLLDAFRKDEVLKTKVLVCAMDAKFDDLRKNDERVYKRFYPSTTSVALSTAGDFRTVLAEQFDIVHLFCDVDAQGGVADLTGSRSNGAELLQACLEGGVKLLWIASDNFAEPYNAGFKAKGMKMNVILTERRLGPNFSLFLDALLTKLSAGEPFAKAWDVVSKPAGKSVQPDVPHTITSLGRGGVILRP